MEKVNINDMEENQTHPSEIITTIADVSHSAQSENNPTSFSVDDSNHENQNATVESQAVETSITGSSTDPNEDPETLNRKLELLLNLADSYSSLLSNGSKAAHAEKNQNENLAGRSHILTEKEEDAILLNDAETFDEEAIITKQPSCITGKMKEYQVEGLNWLYQIYKINVNGILADEMGLGKTLQTISILGYLSFEKKQPGRHLIICPRSTFENWCNEIARWCPQLRVVALHGQKEVREALFKEELSKKEYDICLTTYEMVILEKSRLAKIPWTYLIMDEAHRIKNEKSVLSEVVRGFKSKHRLLITGTPLQNNLKELWALLNFLMPEMFDSSRDFNRLFDFSRIDSQGEQQLVVSTIHRILRPFMLRRLKADVETDLLPKRQVYIFVGMSKLQKQLYSQILGKNVEVLNSMTGNKTQLLNILMQLRKCCNHPYLFDGVEPGPPYIEGPHLVENAGKMVLLMKLLERLQKDGSRVLLFSQMTRLLDIVDDFLRWKGYSYCRIDGTTPGIERQVRIDEFNAEGSSKFIFILSTRAGGLGINLATADVVILYDSDFNPQMDLQAMDRAHRIGQKKSVVVYRFVTENTVEERIVERAAKKLKLDSLVIQKEKFGTHSKGTNSRELHDIIQFGAQEVYRAQDESSITDADVDAILADANQRTEQIQKQLSSLESAFDLSSISLDGGLNMYGGQTNEMMEQKKNAKKSLPQFFDLGDRKTKWKPEERKVRKAQPRRQLTGWRAEMQGGYDFQLYDQERLDQLDDIQKKWEDWLKKESDQAESPEKLASSQSLEVKEESHNEAETLSPGKVESETFGDALNDGLSLKDFNEEELRQILYTLEFHMHLDLDHSSDSKTSLFRKCRDLITPASAGEFRFKSKIFEEAIQELESMLRDSRAWKMEMPAAMMSRSNRVTRNVKTDDLKKSSSANETVLPRKLTRRRLKRRGELDPSRPLEFTNELRREKALLLSQGFKNWTRSEFVKLVNALIEFGKGQLDEIWRIAFQSSNKTLKDIKQYTKAFFEKYSEIEGGEKIMSKIKKAEEVRNAVLQQNEAILLKVEDQLKTGISRPQELTLPSSLCSSKIFTPDEDKILLWGLYEHGSTAYHLTHVSSRYYWYPCKGFFSIATKTLKDVEDRCKEIVETVEADWLSSKEKLAKQSSSNSRRRVTISNTLKSTSRRGQESNATTQSLDSNSADDSHASDGVGSTESKSRRDRSTTPDKKKGSDNVYNTNVNTKKRGSSLIPKLPTSKRLATTENVRSGSNSPSMSEVLRKKKAWSVTTKKDSHRMTSRR